MNVGLEARVVRQRTALTPPGGNGGKQKWKVRQEAFQELGDRYAAAGEDDPVFAEHGAARHLPGRAVPRSACNVSIVGAEEDLPKLAGDSNAAAQGQGVATCCTFLERAPNPARCAGALAPVLVSKCLSARMATQRSAREALLLLIDVGAVEDTLAALEAGLKDKKVKVPPTCLQVMRDAVVKHGAALPLNRVAGTARDVRASLPPRPHDPRSRLAPRPVAVPRGQQMNTSNPAARAAVKDLASALYRHMGEALWAKLDGALRSAQETELKELFAKEASRTDVADPVPLRPQRAASRQGAEAGGAEGGGAASTTEAPAVALSSSGPTDAAEGAPQTDSWSMLDERDLMESLDLAGFEQGLAEKKWKDRAAVRGGRALPARRSRRQVTGPHSSASHTHPPPLPFPPPPPPPFLHRLWTRCSSCAVPCPN